MCLLLCEATLYDSRQKKKTKFDPSHCVLTARIACTHINAPYFLVVLLVGIHTAMLSLSIFLNVPSLPDFHLFVVSPSGKEYRDTITATDVHNLSTMAIQCTVLQVKVFACSISPCCHSTFVKLLPCIAHFMKLTEQQVIIGQLSCRSCLITGAASFALGVG